jgi:hypothetical protein
MQDHSMTDLPSSEPNGDPDVPSPLEPERTPQPGPAGPRTPYPVDDPGIASPDRPGSAPDVAPGRPLDPGIQI